ncbi:hypothetical protein [Bulleidia sp. zg-1006]|uniref:hypothetical protein n=1 Tax=Bulleidia sp. zg-1006 TaxID=2806552 RepID=UPI00193A9098|nr:hypothetical protein [Bulleidia sp. zg-1006]QRG86072.1 hypothetical protein JOS54_04145 [Bulleidia sp. zg-1006]
MFSDLGEVTQVFTKIVMIGWGINFLYGIMQIAQGLHDHHGVSKQKGIKRCIMSSMVIAVIEILF